MKRVAALLVVLAAVPSTAAAQGLPVSAFSDTRAVPTPAEAALLLPSLRAVCPRGRPASARPLALRKAVKGAERVLKKRKLTRFRKNRQAKRPRKAQELAVAGVARRNPAGALAGFLAAHRREARNPLHLLNASVMLTRLGKPREALAMIAAAERLPAPRRTPMGIGVRGLALNNRGFALIALRQFRDAERVLKQAIRAEPLLAEANLNLATARLCGGRTSQAIAPYIAGQRRSVEGGVEVAEVQPAAGNALDMSLGRAGEPPKVRLPGTVEAGVASAATWQALKDQRYGEANQLYEQANATLMEMSNLLGSRPQLEARRASEILGLFNERDRQRPEIGAAKQALLDMEPVMSNAYVAWQDEVSRISDDCFEAGGTSGEIEACNRARCVPATASHHGTWLGLIADVDNRLRVYSRLLHAYASGLASNLANPVYQRTIMSATQHEIMSLYASRVVLEIASRTDSEEIEKDRCAGSGGEPTSEEGGSDFPFPTACPPELQAIKVAFSIDFASFSVSCESVSVQVSLPHALSPFAQVGYDIGSGSTTVFVGARAGGSIPGIKANARAGIYMSFDSRGTATDVGIRGQVGAGGPSLPGVGGPSLGGKVDYSLAGTFL